MNNINFEKIINETLKKDIDFSEVFYENTIKRNLIFLNKRLDKINSKNIEGIGVRLIKDDVQVHASTTNFDEDNINKIIKNLSVVFKDSRNQKSIKLKEEKIKNNNETLYEIEDTEKIKLMHHIDNYVRKLDKRISQVQMSLFEETQNVVIANSNSKLIKDKRKRKRLDISIYMNDNGRQEFSSKRISCSGGFEGINKNDFEEIAQDLVKSVQEKLKSVPCKGGIMPVIIGNGFGGVIFHEACVHSLEATTVSKSIGPFVNKIGKKIASSKVTIIDDGNILNAWGSTNIDDEGNPTQKNILIKDGILKTYLVDYFNSRIMKVNPTGSNRREDYTYSPTSRMNNTYLAKGNDKISDMIKSIDYGLYAKEMGGGSVDPLTGDFNFAVSKANIIRNGIVCEPVSDVCLIGNGKEILQNVEMVSDDLELSAGYCGSISGYVPVQVGQPTIKISNILVSGGGEENEL